MHFIRHFIIALLVLLSMEPVFGLGSKDQSNSTESLVSLDDQAYQQWLHTSKELRTSQAAGFALTLTESLSREAILRIEKIYEKLEERDSHSCACRWALSEHVSTMGDADVHDALKKEKDITLTHALCMERKEGACEFPKCLNLFLDLWGFSDFQLKEVYAIEILDLFTGVLCLRGFLPDSPDGLSINLEGKWQGSHHRHATSWIVPPKGRARAKRLPKPIWFTGC